MALFKLPGEFQYEGVYFSGTHRSAKMIDYAKSLILTPDDILLAAYPKSGTAWMKGLIKLVMSDGEDAPAESDITEFPRLGLRLFDKTEEDTIEFFKQRPSPRCFGTHLNASFLQKQIKEDKAKVIVVMRNPKDTLVSFYHFYKMASFLGNFTGSWDDFFQLFQAKHLLAGDIFEYNLGYWQLREQSNVLVVFYEDMKKDCKKAIRDVATFLGRQLSDEVVEKIVEKANFQQMKVNPDLVENKEMAHLFDSNQGTYFRKGKVGDWRNYFSEQQKAYVEQRSKEMWDPVGLVFEDFENEMPCKVGVL